MGPLFEVSGSLDGRSMALGQTLDILGPALISGVTANLVADPPPGVGITPVIETSAHHLRLKPSTRNDKRHRRASIRLQRTVDFSQGSSTWRDGAVHWGVQCSGN